MVHDGEPICFLVFSFLFFAPSFLLFVVIVNLVMMLWIGCFDNFSNWNFLVVFVKCDDFQV